MRRGRSGGLDGVLVVAKPSGPTSHDVVGLVRRLSSTRRVGHGGTLDPFAAGVLPVFLGRATRLVEYHLGASKRYRATICFGERSTTDDIDGQRTPVEGPPVTREVVEPALAGLVGPISQVPPNYSAVQIQGRRAYQLARSGEIVVLAARDVTIHSLDLVEWDDRDPARPVAIVDVTCSAGTYIRALARDLGEQLGSGAYLGALVRTASGGFRLEDAISLDDLRAAAADGPAGVARVLRPIDAGLEHLPHAEVTDDEIRRLGEGLITAPKRALADRDAPIVLAVGPDGRVAAVCRSVAGALYPHKVLVERPETYGEAGPGSAATGLEPVTEGA
ncbi:MAG TPA: tRNA pseudouridine(55) synthase TruB [Candidatus Limnocylindrales bacterium]|jgi:tRNA pseudouridine55 synthase